MDVLSAHAPIAAPSVGEQWSISIVVPVYNEEAVLPEFHRRLGMVLDGLRARSEIVYVNDGSRDGTMAFLTELHARDPRVAVIDLSRNFGKEIAMSAGIDHADGDGCGHRFRPAGSARAHSRYDPRLARGAMSW
jgi:cellulose synthase/poly-beta-1,6-N-acetylglucosamine synthase-like glycosyltransferase